MHGQTGATPTSRAPSGTPRCSAWLAVAACIAVALTARKAWMQPLTIDGQKWEVPASVASNDGLSQITASPSPTVSPPPRTQPPPTRSVFATTRHASQTDAPSSKVHGNPAITAKKLKMTPLPVALDGKPDVPAPTLTVYPSEGAQWLHLDGRHERGVSNASDVNRSSDPLLIHFVWVGSEPLSLTHAENIRHWAVIHRYHNAAVYLWANDLPLSSFRSSVRLQRNLSGIRGPYLVRCNWTALAREAMGEASPAVELFRILTAAGQSGSATPRYHAVPMSDAIRLLVVFRFGGAYLDTDMMPLRPLPPQGYRNILPVNTAGKYSCASSNVTIPDTRGGPESLDQGESGGGSRSATEKDPRSGLGTVGTTATGGKTYEIGCLCNCIFFFDRGHFYLERILSDGLRVLRQRAKPPYTRIKYSLLGARVWMAALINITRTRPVTREWLMTAGDPKTLAKFTRMDNMVADARPGMLRRYTENITKAALHTRTGGATSDKAVLSARSLYARVLAVIRSRANVSDEDVFGDHHNHPLSSTRA